jgi:hypothetical protein
LADLPCRYGATINPRTCFTNASATRAAKEIDIGGAGISSAEEFLAGGSRDIEVPLQKFVFL